MSLALGLVDLACQCLSECATSTLTILNEHILTVYTIGTNPSVHALALAVVEVVITILEDLYAFYLNFGVIDIPGPANLDVVLALGSPMNAQLEESTGISYRDVEAKALALLRSKPTLVRLAIFPTEFKTPKNLALNPLAPAFCPAATSTLNPLALPFTPGPVKPKVAESDKPRLSLNPAARPFVPNVSASPSQAKATPNPLPAEFKPLVSVKSSLSATATAFVPTCKPVHMVQTEAPVAHASLSVLAPVFVPKAISLESSKATANAKLGLNALAPVFIPKHEVAPAALSLLNVDVPAFVPTAVRVPTLISAEKPFSPASVEIMNVFSAPPANISASLSLGPHFETSQSFNLFPLPTLSHSVSFSDGASAPSSSLSTSPSCPAYTMGSWESDELTSDSEGSSFTLVDSDENWADYKEVSLTWDNVTSFTGVEKGGLVTMIPLVF